MTEPEPLATLIRIKVFTWGTDLRKVAQARDRLAGWALPSHKKPSTGPAPKELRKRMDPSSDQTPNLDGRIAAFQEAMGAAGLQAALVF